MHASYREARIPEHRQSVVGNGTPNPDGAYISAQAALFVHSGIETVPYLNLDLDYFDHPKTIRLMGLLGPGSAEYPLRLWCYCGKYHTEDGQLMNYSASEIESVCKWHGEPGRLVEALLKVRFIEKQDDGYVVHDWLEHSGHLSVLKRRAKSGAKERWKRYASSNANSGSKHLLASDLAMLVECSIFIDKVGIDKKVLEEFLEDRRERRRPVTKRALKLLLKELEKLKVNGNDPTAVVEQSIMNGWQGVFKLKTEHESSDERWARIEKNLAERERHEKERTGGDQKT